MTGDSRRDGLDDRGKTVRLAATGGGRRVRPVGVLGFIPGITSNYSTLNFAGHVSGAELLGIFQVSVLHNIVHLLFDVAGVAMARTTKNGWPT